MTLDEAVEKLQEIEGKSRQNSWYGYLRGRMRAGSRHRRQAPVRSMTGATGDLWKRWNKHFYLARNTKECAEMHVHALHKKESDATHTSLSSKGEL